MPRRLSAAPPLPAADFLVIGSGVAGLRAAIGLSRAGRVLVLTKGSPAEGSSIYAQGGVAVRPLGVDIRLAPDGNFAAGEEPLPPVAGAERVREGPARGQGLIPFGDP